MRIADDLTVVGAVQTRQTFHVDDVDSAKGELFGRVVPYDLRVELLPDVYEVFEEGAFGAQPQARDHWARIQLRWAHATDEVPLGKAVELQERGDGLYGRFLFNAALRSQPGSRAWEVWQSLEAGDMDELSVGFRVKRVPEVSDAGGGLLLTRQRDSCHLVETSVVPAGAYGQAAKVAALRDTRDVWRESWRTRIAALR